MDEDLNNDNWKLSSAIQKQIENNWEDGDLELIDLIKSLKTENESLRDDIDRHATLYDDKIKKYDQAILERDHMINQLKSSLGNCMEHQNQLEKELQVQADEFNVEIEKLREDLFGKELKASNNFTENYRELQVQVEELLLRICRLDESLDAAYKDKEFIVKEWKTKYDNMISGLRKLHNDEVVEIKALQEKEVAMISKQFDIIEKNHKENHSHMTESLKKAIDTKDNIQNELEVEKGKYLMASTKLMETQTLLESLQEFCKTSESSYKELLRQQHEKNVLDNETIMHLESELLKNNELISENETKISVLSAEIKALTYKKKVSSISCGNTIENGRNVIVIEKQITGQVDLSCDIAKEVDGEKDINGDNIRKLELFCKTCRTKLSTNEDKCLQTSISDSLSSHITTKTIEEDYLMEEILIFPQHIEKRGSCMKIKDPSNLNEWRKKYFDVKFVNKSLKNENLNLKKALCKDNVVDEAINICGGSEDQFPAVQDVKNPCNFVYLPVCEQESLINSMSNLKHLENKHQQRMQEMNTLDIFNIIFRNSEEFLVENQPISDVCNVMENEENIVSNEFRLRHLSQPPENLNLFMIFKSLCECVQILWNKNYNLRKEISDGESDKQEIIDLLMATISLTSSQQIDASIPASDNVQMKILQIELQIQVIFNEILKQLFMDKELYKDMSKELLCAQDYIRCGIGMFLENSNQCSLIKKDIADCLLSEWVRVLQECLNVRSLAISDARSQSADTISLLQNIELQLRSVLNELRECRKDCKDVENNLIASMEKNFRLFRGKEAVDRSNIYLLNSIAGAGSKCSYKIGVQISTRQIGEDLLGSEEDNTEDEGNEMIVGNVAKAEGIDDSIEEINRQILKEFDDITVSFVNHELNEKIQIVETQKNLLKKILLNIQHKIAEICQNHLQELKNYSTLDDLGQMVDSFIDNVKQSLSEETSVIENDYGEFLRQYTHEQSSHFNTLTLSFMELKERISIVLQDDVNQKNHKMTSENNKNNELFSEDFSCIKYEEKFATMSSFTDLESQKRILYIMTLMTLNLMHYYSISQNYSLRSNNIEEDNVETSGYIDDSFDKSKCSFGPSSIHSKFTRYENLGDDLFQNKDYEEGITIQNPLDTTAVSEGMLEDLDKDEQIKKVLPSTCTNLIAALKGKLEEISVNELEKEVQEFIISLQASAGMLKIKFSKEAEPLDNSLTLENCYLPELSQHPISSFTDPESMFICRDTSFLQDFFQSVSNDSLNPKECSGRTTSSNYENKEIEDNLDAGQSVLDTEFKETDENALCLPGDGTLDYTNLKIPKVHKDKLIESMGEKLRELYGQRNLLKKQFHQINGHLRGVLEEKKVLDKEKCHMEENNIKLSKELQEMKNLFDHSEYKNKELLKSLAGSPNKKQSPREIKEKVKAILAAKDIANLEQKELVARVRDLEIILEDLVRGKEEITEILNMKVADLTQQLDHANLQLKKSRLFLDQQAVERDHEFDVLIKDNEKLNCLLKEKEALAIHHQNILKDVSGFEKELIDKNTKLEAAKQEIENRENELKRALDKIKDLRDITQSLELQLNSKCLENLQLNEKVQLLTEDLLKENRLFQDAKMQLEKILSDRRTSIINSHEYTNVEYDDSSMAHRRVSRSLSEEFENANEKELCPKASQEHSVLHSFVDLLQRSVIMLESLQASSTSGLALSDEELSVRERLEISRYDTLEENHSLSPSSLEHELGERLIAFERTVETAVKYSKDLEMRNKVIKADLEEIVSERDELHQKLCCFLDLKAKLENYSIEYNELQESFCELKKELLDSQDSLTVCHAQITKFEFKNKALEEELDNQMKLIDSISLENSRMLQHIKVLEKKVKELEDLELKNDTIKVELESKILELGTERDCLQKQYSKQLLKLSSAESRLEDIRRTNSPQDHEFKMKISFLQDELAKSQEEIALIYRQNDELSFTLRDFKEKLLLRDEELDRINRGNFNQPSSHPLTATNHEYHHIQRLNNEIAMQKEKYGMLNVKEGYLHSQINDRSPEIPRKHSEKSPNAISSNLTLPLWDNEFNKLGIANVSTFEEAKSVSSIQPSKFSDLSFESIHHIVKKNPTYVAEELGDCTAEKAEIYLLHETNEDHQSKEINLSDKFYAAILGEEKVSELKKGDDMVPYNSLESLNADARKYLEEINVLEGILEKVKCQENNLQKEQLLMEKDFAERECLLSQQKFILISKDQEVEELNDQLNNLITQLKDNSTINEKRLNQAYQMHISIVHEMNQKSIEREKQLCNDYEERMASQVTDLSMKLTREKSEGLKQVKNYYQTLLKKKDCFIAELKILLQERKIICTVDSAQDLQVKECSNIEQLECDTNEHRNSSNNHFIGNDTNHPNTSTSVTQRIQTLMRKVLKEGEQVLTQTERLFLEQNCDTFCSTLCNKRSSPEYSIASHSVTLEPQENAVHADKVDKPILLKQISQSKKEANKKINLLNYCSKQEECFVEEWHELMEIAETENVQLRKQLSSEKFRSFNLTSELTQVRCQLQILENQIQCLQQERDSLSCQIEAIEKQNEDLEEALHAERNNFSRVSLTLNHQRKLATSTSEHQNKLIQEIRKTLEDERTRVMNLVSQLHASKLSPDIRALLNNTSMSENNEHLSVFIEKELEAGFTKDQERKIKLKLEEAELNFKTLKEKFINERSEHLSQLGEEQMKVAQLQKVIVFFERDKETLVKNLHQKIEEIVKLKEQLSNLQKENIHVKSELSVLSSFPHEDSKKVVQEQISYAANDLNLNEYQNLQQNERKELCMSLSRLSDDRQNLKQTIVSLEALVLELNEKVAYYKSKAKEENIDERLPIEAKKSALQISCRQLEARNALLSKQLSEREAQSGHIINPDSSDLGIMYMLWKYKRCESYRKALIWQKNFLLTMLEGFQKTETQALQRLTSFVQKDKYFQDYNKSPSLSCRFRPAVLVIISIHRMKYLVKRWQLGKRIEDASVHSKSNAANILEYLEDQETCSKLQVTGQSPPTKDKSKDIINKQQSEFQKNVYDTGLLSNFDEYISRIEHIHAALGIPSSKT